MFEIQKTLDVFQLIQLTTILMVLAVKRELFLQPPSQSSDYEINSGAINGFLKVCSLIIQYSGLNVTGVTLLVQYTVVKINSVFLMSIARIVYYRAIER